MAFIIVTKELCENERGQYAFIIVEIRGLRPLIGLVSSGLNALERSLRGCALMGLKP
jgi:hypothetical protein